MQIDIEATNLELTAPLRTYIEEKLGKLDKFLKRFDQGGLRIRVEVARMTKHHRHGEVYYAEANLYFPGGMFRAEHSAEDIRVAISKVADKLKREAKEHKRSH